MKISGFTFCRDAVRFDYPIVESIRSILPVVDEYIVNVGKSDDGTSDLIQSIGDPKIRIIESIWDESLRKDGLIFSQQTNIALSRCTGDWAFYLQADEVVNEADLPRIREAMEQYITDPQVLGLMFLYLHFKGDYWSVDPWMYRKEIRIIRNNGEVCSHGDATGFASRATGFSRNLKTDPSCWRWSGGRIFHYGYVKSSRMMMAKIYIQASFHDPNPTIGLQKLRHMFDPDTNSYPFDERYPILKEFKGNHPAVMQARFARSTRLGPRRSRWFNWKFYKEVLRHGFKG